MAIEIVPRPKIKIPRWVFIALAIFVISLLGLTISYFYFDKSSEELSQEIQEKEKALIKTPLERALEEDILSKEKKISSFSNLILVHRKSFNIFNFLEKVCHPQVSFSEFDFTSQKELIEVEGQATSFVVLGQQILILKKEESIKKINLSEVSIGKEGEIEFSLQLTLGPQSFTQ